MRKLSAIFIGLGSILVVFSVVVWAAGLGVHKRVIASPVHTNEITFSATSEEGYEGRLYMVRSNGSGLRPIEAVGKVLFGSLFWSPDGRLFAFTRRESSNTEDIYLANGSFSKLWKLTRLGGINIAESWSPDGRALLIQHLDFSCLFRPSQVSASRSMPSSATALL